MTGYHPDYSFLESLGIRIGDDVYRTPIVDEASFESSRPGLYLAGTVCGGYLTNRWFIENGRFHARQIVKHIAHNPLEAVRFDESTGKRRSGEIGDELDPIIHGGSVL